MDCSRLIFAVAIIAATWFFAPAQLSAASSDPSETPAPVESLSIGGAAINLEIEAGDLSLSRTQLLGWVRRSACAVTEYYAGFPVRSVDLKIVPIDEGKGVLFGRTVLVDQTLVIRVGLSRFATESSLRNDWVMTHEMVHLALPSVPDEHHWIEEGIATYVEPIARAQVGDLSPETVWRELVDGLPKGLPAPGDRGLDKHSHMGPHLLGRGVVLLDGGYRDSPTHQQSIRAPGCVAGNCPRRRQYGTRLATHAGSEGGRRCYGRTGPHGVVRSDEGNPDNARSSGAVASIGDSAFRQFGRVRSRGTARLCRAIDYGEAIRPRLGLRAGRSPSRIDRRFHERSGDRRCFLTPAQIEHIA